MKVYRRKPIPIVVDHQRFIGIVNEKPYDFIFRAYSSKHKNSFMEVYFDWRDTYYINPYRPLIRSVLIQYGLNHGWDPKRPNQRLVIKDSKPLIEELSLKEL